MFTSFIKIFRSLMMTSSNGNIFHVTGPFVRGIHRWPVNSLHKGQWRGALMFSLICAWTNGWVNNRNSDDLRHHHAHYDVTVMESWISLDMVNIIFVSTPLQMSMMTSSNGNIFRVTGPLCGEFIGHRWIPHTKASDAELWYFLWSVPE